MNTNRAKFLSSTKHYFIMLLGVAILSFGLYNIHSQSGITEGGVLGLTLLFQHWFHISPGISGIIMDILCYILGFKLLGKAFLKNAIFSSVGFSICYNIYEHFGYIIPDLSTKPFLASIVGGIFVGVGVGLVVREGGASGGDDALALVIAKLAKCKISRAYFFTDFVVLMLSLTYIPVKYIIFSLITVTISSFIIECLQPRHKSTPPTHNDECPT